MTQLVAKLTVFDLFFFRALFRLSGQRLLRKLIFFFSWTANGYFYPIAAGFACYARPQDAKIIMLTWCLAVALHLPVYKLLKTVLKRHRPCAALEGLCGWINPADEFSFPSGHTGAAFLMAAMFSAFFPILAIPLYTWAALVGISRIMLGVHYPSDIIAGAVMGLVIARFSLGFFL